MPIFTQFFEDIYGWRGASLMLCGVSLHAVVCAMLFKPVHKHDKDEYYLVPSDDDLQGMKDRNNDLNKRNSKNSVQQLVSVMDDYLDISLFADSSFIAMFILFAGDGLFTTSWLIYVVPHALDIGFSPYMSSVVATVGGIGSLVGNCLFPVLGKIMSSKAQLYVSLCVIATSFAADVVAINLVSFTGIITCSVAFGFARGTLTTAMYAIINDTTQEDKVINAMGWFYAVYGLASILGGFLCGKSLYCKVD